MSSQKAAGGELSRSVHSPAAPIRFLVTTVPFSSKFLQGFFLTEPYRTGNVSLSALPFGNQLT